MFLFLNQLIAFVCGLVFNSALLYLIYTKTPSLMQPYSVILRIHAVSDLISDIVNFATSTHCIFLEGRFYFVNGLIHRGYWSPTVAFFAVETYLFIVVYVPLGLAPLDFYYRLRTVCLDKTLSKRQITLFVLFAYFFAFLVAFPLNAAFMKAGPSESTVKYDQILQQALEAKQLTGYLTMGLWEPLDCFVMFLIISVVVIDYTFIGYVLWKIREKMREHVSLNVSTKAVEIQKQVGRIMLLQALIPLLLCLPLSTNILSAYLKMNFSGLSSIVFSSISWLSALKSIATLFKLSSLSISSSNLSFQT